MNIVHIVPGSGGTFYCQNCMRDNELIRSLKTLGHEIHMVPMYLPISVDDHDTIDDTPVFYGAINIFLKEKISFYRSGKAGSDWRKLWRLPDQLDHHAYGPLQSRNPGSQHLRYSHRLG